MQTQGNATVTGRRCRPGGTLSALSVLFVLFALLAPDGGRPGEGQGVNSPRRVWRGESNFFICALVSFVVLAHTPKIRTYQVSLKNRSVEKQTAQSYERTVIVLSQGFALRTWKI